MSEDTAEFNQRAAKKLAEQRDFDPENMMCCPECGRTVVRTQKMGNPGYRDNIYCTCESYGPPYFPVEETND